MQGITRQFIEEIFDTIDGDITGDYIIWNFSISEPKRFVIVWAIDTDNDIHKFFIRKRELGIMDEPAKMFLATKELKVALTLWDEIGS